MFSWRASAETITPAEIASHPRAPNVVPALIADLGDEAAWRYVEFFTANIRNPHPRRAYARVRVPGSSPGAKIAVMRTAIRPNCGIFAIAR